ncbi:unnamed protein product [Bursaphelenchus okinawaensis]|uniref:Uncharacterized protein n=1 Tax=Bursaphelenchus okinawaensis TaxID=465554 RepID=A0A811KRL4_9BILA|nr:unnamed protein product [Bursaphelenchus okinawaensis]CAG9109877.1 unnamed protein product [Bursaphelenchus okinawaensis]
MSNNFTFRNTGQFTIATIPVRTFFVRERNDEPWRSKKLVQDGSENDLNKTLSETNDTVTEGKRLGRDALNFMETDLSTELTVMPLGEEIREVVCAIQVTPFNALRICLVCVSLVMSTVARYSLV